VLARTPLNSWGRHDSTIEPTLFLSSGDAAVGSRASYTDIMSGHYS
jgi:hypothetical protein